MQVTINVVRLPSTLLDAYLEMLSASINPILAEEDIPAKSQEKLLQSAFFACAKSICMKFEKEIEAAGMFKDVVSIDYPGFKWNRGLKFCYAVDMISPSIVKTLAEEMVEGRDVSSFLDILEAWADIRIDKHTGDLLEHIEGPAARRLEEHALGLASANESLMIGETPLMMTRLLNNVKSNLEVGSDTPLDCLSQDMEFLLPSVVVYL